MFSEFGSLKKCRCSRVGGVIIHRLAKGGMGSKSLRTPGLVLMLISPAWQFNDLGYLEVFDIANFK